MPMTSLAPPPTPALAVPQVAPAFSAVAECKCCGAPAVLEGYADLDRDCYGVNAKRGQMHGVPVPYYRCAGCDFAFTPWMDDWSPEEFGARIYNDDYAQFDPRFDTERPRSTCALVQKIFGDRDIRILDFGAGNGLTAQLLRDAGYREVVAWDPFHGDALARPQGRFDLVLCVEVAEHTPRPLELFASLAALVDEGGAVLLSTKDFSEVKGRWVDDWYVAPRNGHISFYSQRTLRLIAASIGRDYLKVDSFRHLLLPRRAPQAAAA